MLCLQQTIFIYSGWLFTNKLILSDFCGSFLSIENYVFFQESTQGFEKCNNFYFFKSSSKKKNVHFLLPYRGLVAGLNKNMLWGKLFTGKVMNPMLLWINMYWI